MRVSNTEALMKLAGRGHYPFTVTDATADDGNVIISIVLKGGDQFDLTFVFQGELATQEDLAAFRALCIAVGLDKAPEDKSEIAGRRGNMWVPTHGGSPRFSAIERPPYPYPPEPPRQHVETQGNESTLQARRQARDISTRSDRRAHGYGLLLEIENGRICGVEHIEQSPVPYPEDDIWLDFEGTRRRGLRLVEWNGKGEAPAHALRWAADIYCADSRTAAFVRAAIEEKLATDYGYAVATGEIR